MYKRQLFSRVQDRNYWQFDQYMRIFKPDACLLYTSIGKAFGRGGKSKYGESDDSGPQGDQLATKAGGGSSGGHCWNAADRFCSG